MRWPLRQGVVFVVFALCVAAPTRAADPLLMLLINLAREMIAAETARPAPERALPAPAPELYPGTTVEPAVLRRLIHDSFLYLSEQQRQEVFEALHQELLKPENAVVRASMIEYFARRALQIREAQLRLANLSHAEMSGLAEEFAQRAAALPPEEREHLNEVLDRGMLPVPEALNRLFVASLRGLDESGGEGDATPRTP